MTEPSKEAVEAAQANGTSLDRIRITEGQARVILKAALPIERERWEKDVRERAGQLREETLEAASDASVYADLDPEYLQAMVDAAIERLLDSVFEKVESK